MTPDFDVVVIGSVNLDLTVLTPRHPAPGETVLGTGHRWGGGGKGANQAVAAARLGSRTALIGRVGSDDNGRALRASLEGEGIDVACLGSDPSEPTGLAVITLDQGAENSIIVSPGANMALLPDRIRDCEPSLAGARVVLAQLEIPVDTVLAAARATSGLFCLNPAPARPLPPELLYAVDVLIPNRSELAILAARDLPEGREHVTDAARSIQGPKAVVVTLGADGALIIEGDEVTHVPAPDIDPVDTTGAGDAFCGALADALARGEPLTAAVRRATLAGGLAATRHGAQQAMPTREDLESLSER